MQGCKDLKWIEFLLYRSILRVILRLSSFHTVENFEDMLITFDALVRFELRMNATENDSDPATFSTTAHGKPYFKKSLHKLL